MHDSLAPDVTEQLLDLREPGGEQYAAVTALLVAAAGPARPAELTGEDSALRAFRLAYRARRKRRSGLIAGAALVVVSVGGTAYAAGGDHLPDPVQRTVEALFGTRNTPPSAAPGPTGAPTVTPAPPSPAAAPAGNIEHLCRTWEAARTDPHAPRVTGEERAELARAAKNPAGIDDYCHAVLADATPSPAGSAPPTATHGSKAPTKAPTKAPSKQDTAKPGNGQQGAGPSHTRPAKPARS
ncbi:hypothetical protein AB0H83_26125 [Dactylosporangium sp. NPDC050688]|uniref:hypothetical protein n=1 Tax=Dactylosporangium sp. NPDC050688 TaxID=3157217 RepID=UPI0033CBAE9A